MTPSMALSLLMCLSSLHVVQPGKEKDPLSTIITVRDVIKSLGLDESKMSYSHEPAGKIRALRWPATKLPGTEVQVEVVVELEHVLLALTKEVPDIKKVRELTVTKVMITPVKID